MIDQQDIIEYYSKKDVQDEIIRTAKDKECVGRFGLQGFATRPDTINYGQEIMDQVESGITSFHFSEETWDNIYNISTGMNKKELDKQRKGWDLILDIDSKHFEISKICADLIIKALKYHDIKSISCKFSGNKGFHIAVPFEAFPQVIGNKETKLLFPEMPRLIAQYINHMITDKLSNAIIKEFELNMPSKLREFSKLIGIEHSELITNDKLNIDKIIEIDTILINSRHLCRAVYSVHEKSGLVSIPIDIDKVKEFQRDYARPDIISVERNVFLNRDHANPEECKQLLLQAIDFDKAQQKEYGENFIKTKTKIDYDESRFKETIKIIPDAFPPCIKNILNGVGDGRKRALFVLINFLKTAGYDNEEITTIIYDWNKNNKEALRETYIKGQLSYMRRNKVAPPPNCSNSVYKDLQVCTPEPLCQRIKNPISQATRKHFALTAEAEKERKKQEKREQRKKEREEKKEKEKAREKEAQKTEEQKEAPPIENSQNIDNES